MKKKICILILLSLIFSSVTLSAESKNGDFNLWGSGEVFKLTPMTEGLLIGGGTLLYGTELILDKGLKLGELKYENQKYNLENLNPLDRKLAQPYNHTVDKISDVLLISSFALPLCLLPAENSEWMTVATMYAETMLLAQGIKESIKLGVFRPRPYMYFDGWPEKDVLKENDWCNSFVSGHSTMSFTAATFTAYTFWKYFPDSPWRFAVAGGCYALSTTIALLRVGAGCHFPTDILSGAVLGTVCGFVVPWLHTLNAGKNNEGKGDISLNALPLGISFTIGL